MRTSAPVVVREISHGDELASRQGSSKTRCGVPIPVKAIADDADVEVIARAFVDVLCTSQYETHQELVDSIGGRLSLTRTRVSSEKVTYRL